MRFTIIIALLFSLVVFTGCQQDNPFGTVHLEGTVTFNGEPLADASVTLMPHNVELMTAGGMTDARGRFTVTTGGAPLGSGAQPGTYDVTFSKFIMEGGDLTQEEHQAMFGRGRASIIHLIPERFGNPRTSGIDPITVTTDRRQNVFTFELTE